MLGYRVEERKGEAGGARPGMHLWAAVYVCEEWYNVVSVRQFVMVKVFEPVLRTPRVKGEVLGGSDG